MIWIFSFLSIRFIWSIKFVPKIIGQKGILIVSFILDNLTSLPTKDPTNGIKLFSSKVIKSFPIESKLGFTFAIELLAKSYRNNYKIAEVPALSPIRNFGKSKFSYYSIIFYLPWFIYILLTKPKKS